MQMKGQAQVGLSDTCLAAFTKEGEERLALGKAAHRVTKAFFSFLHGAQGLLSPYVGGGPGRSWSSATRRPASHIPKNLTGKDTLNLGNRSTGVRGVVRQVPRNPKTWPQPQSGKLRLSTLYIHIQGC